MPESDGDPPIQPVKEPIFIFVSTIFVIALIMEATLPSFSVWRMRKYGTKSLARCIRESRSGPRGESMRMKCKNDASLNVISTLASNAVTTRAKNHMIKM